MSVMDYRQYDNALGRFNGVDALAELDYSGSPYSFGFNNPVYFSDPSGLTAQEPDTDPPRNGILLDDVVVKSNYKGPGAISQYFYSGVDVNSSFLNSFPLGISAVSRGGGGGSITPAGLVSFESDPIVAAMMRNYASPYSNPVASPAQAGLVSAVGLGPSTTYYGNYLGPGSDITHPTVMRYALGVEPIDIIDLAAFYHDIAYFEAGVGGVDGAINSIKVIEADKMLASQASIVIISYWLRATDPITKKPISFETYMWAKGVLTLFGSISSYKQYQVNQYYNSKNTH